MTIKDIVMEPGQIAVLLYMYREDGYNFGGVFQTATLAYEHAMNLREDLAIHRDYCGFCIETRKIVDEANAEDYYAFEEYYFGLQGELRYALENASDMSGRTFYQCDEVREHLCEEAVSVKEFVYRHTPEAMDDAAEAVFDRYRQAFLDLAQNECPEHINEFRNI